MATLDEILKKTPPGSGDQPPKGSAHSAEQNSGSEASVSSGATTNPVAEAKPSSSGGTSVASGGYEELFRKLNPYTPPTAEDIEKERKRAKRAQMFSAIGDGIAALSNLYFTTQYAPHMHDGAHTMSAATKARYDKLLKDREEKTVAYYNGLMRAKQADADNAHRDRAWQRQLNLDRYELEKDKESAAHRKEREKIADDRYNREQEYKRGRDEESDRRWQADFDENKRRSDRSYNFQVRQHNDNVAVRREQVRATAARGVRGKQLGFADGNGNQVSIYENVWKGSMQQVYDVLYADMVDAYNKDKKNNPRVPRHKTQGEKEDFVKQNWHKSPKASQIMIALSGIDPATMVSELSDDVEDYIPEDDDEVIDYTPGNK